MRKIVFTNNNYYHIFNRGVDKRKVFLTRYHFVRFIRTINNLLRIGIATPKITEFNSSVFIDKSLALEKKLSFVCYCLMSNHYHFIVRQIKDNGISEFMHQLNTSYTKYFNLNQKRIGRLFEYTFKAKLIDSEEQLLHLSRYIHLNPLVSNLTNDLTKYKWSSYVDYLGLRNGKLCNKEEVLGLFTGNNPSEEYENFLIDQIGYARELNIIKETMFD